MKKFIPYIIITLLVIGLIIWFLERKKRQKIDALSQLAYNNHYTKKPSQEQSPYSTLQFQSDFPLTINSTGSNVLLLQQALNTVITIPFQPLKEDGIFGIETAEAANRTFGTLTGHTDNIVTWAEYRSI